MSELPVTPRPAATLMLVRDASSGIEVFMLQRTHEAAFGPGKYVFPGGSVDRSDSEASFEVHCAGHDDSTASRLLGVKDGGLAYSVAAIRECFEEAGILFACDKSGRPVEAASDKISALRDEWTSTDMAFGDFCGSRHLRLAFDKLVYFGHWITPVGMPRRFDTRFFVAVAPEKQIASHDNSETIGQVWIRPSEALERHRAGEIDLMFATIHSLETLARFQDTGTLMKHVRSLGPIPARLPRVAAGRNGRRVLIQGDHAYAEVGKLDPAGKGKASCDILPGVVTQLSEQVRRIAAPNPGFMTGPGTNTYLVGSGDALAVIDPGPADEGHIEALLEHANGRIRWILTTHTHLDHSPAASLIKAHTGAQLLGMPSPDSDRQDQSYQPDIVLKDNQRITVGDCILRAIHTPGHASNHLCYLLEEERLLFTGDHVMQGSTVVINPPDGDMGAYLASLHKIKTLDVDYFAPGHGFLMAHPNVVIERLLAHRLNREQKVLAALRSLESATIDELLPIVYGDVPIQRHTMASRSLLAHLEKSRADGQATELDGRWTPLNGTGQYYPGRTHSIGEAGKL